MNNRPLVEMADIVRCAGQAFIERSRKWINWQHQKVLLAITRCRTAALGGHRDRCTGCGHTTRISYNSCRNRHCTRCQGNARRRWLKARERELLPTRYVHAVFTLPQELAPLALQNKRLIYNLLFHASAETLLEVARNPRHLGAEIGFFSVLHSWNQRLQFHPHIHCVVAAGGITPDHSGWISARRSFFLPVGVLGRVFRGKFVAGLRNAFHRGELQFHGSLLALAQPHAFSAWLRVLFRHDWVVYSKPPFGGPQHVLRYLGAYTHRVAISNSRLVALSHGNVTFRWRDSAHGNKKRLMTLAVDGQLPSPLPAPSAATRLRAHPQLRIPCQPQPRYSVAAVLSTPRQLREHGCSASITIHQSDRPTLELPSLRWNYARRRTALRRPTPASLPTSTRPMRCMKLYPHPRPLLVLRRIRRPLVSSSQNPLDHSLSSVHKRPRRANMLLHPALQSSNSAQLTLCLIPLHLFRPIQST